MEKIKLQFGDTLSSINNFIDIYSYNYDIVYQKWTGYTGMSAILGWPLK